MGMTQNFRPWGHPISALILTRTKISGGYLHVWKGCAHEDYCGSKEQLKRVDMFCAGAQNSYQCKLCADKDECNLKGLYN